MNQNASFLPTVVRALAVTGLLVGAAHAQTSPAPPAGGPARDARSARLKLVNVALTGTEDGGFSFKDDDTCDVIRVRHAGAEDEAVELFHVSRVSIGGVHLQSTHGNAKDVENPAVQLRLSGTGTLYETRFPRRHNRDSHHASYHVSIPAAQRDRVLNAWHYLLESPCSGAGTGNPAPR
jgi:hypothetical protein